jgi:hypothetical protein
MVILQAFLSFVKGQFCVVTEIELRLLRVLTRQNETLNMAAVNIAVYKLSNTLYDKKLIEAITKHRRLWRNCYFFSGTGFDKMDVTFLLQLKGERVTAFLEKFLILELFFYYLFLYAER